MEPAMEDMADAAGNAAETAYTAALDSGASPVEAASAAMDAAGVMTDMGAPPEMVNTMVTSASKDSQQQWIREWIQCKLLMQLEILSMQQWKLSMDRWNLLQMACLRQVICPRQQVKWDRMRCPHHLGLRATCLHQEKCRVICRHHQEI